MGVNKPRKEAYKNFYATYDADADFERMKVSLALPKRSVLSSNVFSLSGLWNFPVSSHY